MPDEAEHRGAPRPATPAEDPATHPGAEKRLTTAELFGGATEIAIAHDDTIYRLRITRQGKLILNK